jgi:hypothetical protein
VSARGGDSALVAAGQADGCLTPRRHIAHRHFSNCSSTPPITPQPGPLDRHQHRPCPRISHLSQALVPQSSPTTCLRLAPFRRIAPGLPPNPSCCIHSLLPGRPLSAPVHTLHSAVALVLTQICHTPAWTRPHHNHRSWSRVRYPTAATACCYNLARSGAPIAPVSLCICPWSPLVGMLSFAPPWYDCAPRFNVADAPPSEARLRSRKGSPTV